jgi:hypothetical protein
MKRPTCSFLRFCKRKPLFAAPCRAGTNAIATSTNSETLFVSVREVEKCSIVSCSSLGSASQLIVTLSAQCKIVLGPRLAPVAPGSATSS